MPSPTILSARTLGSTQDELPGAVQGSRDTVTIYWRQRNGQALKLTGATITGTYKDFADDVVYVVDGTYTITDGIQGEFTWAYGAGDVGTAGSKEVQLKVVLADSTVLYSNLVGWSVEATLGAGAVATGVLIGVTPDEAVWLTAAYGTGNALADYLLISSILDEDDLVSDDDTYPPTQQSVKAYVDNGVVADLSTHEGLTNNPHSVTAAQADAVPEDAAILSKSGGYEVAAGDAAKIIECDGTFAINLPDGLDAGFQVAIVNIGAGTITLTADTTISTKDAAVTLPNQYGAATAYHSGSNVWIAFGDLE